MAAWVEVNTRDLSQSTALINQNKPSVSVSGDAGKPALGPKPHLMPKPFSIQRNATIRPIKAPKITASGQLLRSSDALNSKNSDSGETCADGPKTSDVSDGSPAPKSAPLTTKPALTPKPISVHSKIPDITGSDNQTGPNAKPEVISTEDVKYVQRRGRAKSLGSQDQNSLKQKPEEETSSDDADVKTSSARNRLSVELTSRFETQSMPERDETVKTDKPLLSPSASRSSKVETGEMEDDEINGSSIQRRISLLFDRSTASQHRDAFKKKDVTPAEISVDIKQRIKNLTLNTQEPRVRQLSTGALKCLRHEKIQGDAEEPSFSERSFEKPAQSTSVQNGSAQTTAPEKNILLENKNSGLRSSPEPAANEENDKIEEDKENYVTVPLYRRVGMTKDLERKRQEDEEKQCKEEQLEKERKEQERENHLEEERKLRQDIERRQEEERKRAEEKRRLKEERKREEEERRQIEEQRKQEERQLEEERKREAERETQRELERLDREKQIDEQKRSIEKQREKERLREKSEKEERLKKEREMEEKRQIEEERLRQEREKEERLKKEKEMEEQRQFEEEERLRQEREKEEKLKKEREIEERRRIEQEERLRQERERERLRKERELEEKRQIEEQRLRQEREKEEKLKKEREMEERRRIEQEERLRQERERERLRKDRELEEQRLREEREKEEKLKKEKEMEEQRRFEEEERLRQEREKKEKLKKEREMEERRRIEQEERLRQERERERLRKERELEEKRQIEEQRLRQERERERLNLELKFKVETVSSDLICFDADEGSKVSPELNEVSYDDFSVKPTRWGTRSSTPSPSREPSSVDWLESRSSDPEAQGLYGDPNSLSEHEDSSNPTPTETEDVCESESSDEITSHEGELKDCDEGDEDDSSRIRESDEISKTYDDPSTENKVSQALQRLTSSQVKRPNASIDSDTPATFDPVPLLFPESSAPLLDSSVFRSKVDLGKKRSIKRLRPSRAVRQRAALPALTEGSNPDWRFCDSTDAKAQCSNGKESESEEEPSKDATPPPGPSQAKRVPLFPGMDQSALMAQLKRRSAVTETEATERQTSPAVPARSPRSAVLGPRVLPPAGGSGSSPSWLLELKSKKRLSQPESDV